MIEPTIGRIVWYRPSAEEIAHIGAPPEPGKPLAAQVASVNADGTISLMVIDASGDTFGRRNVRLIQDGETAPEGSAYAEWMPYQKGQAAKTEQLLAAAEKPQPAAAPAPDAPPNPPAPQAAEPQPPANPAPAAAPALDTQPPAAT